MIVNLNKSSYYYKKSNKKRGRKTSIFTLKEGIKIDNNIVKNDIKSILSEEFIKYGYKKTTIALRMKGYHINPKKVYRLMQEEKLLLNNRIKTEGKRSFVKTRKVKCDYLFQLIEMDIKYVKIPEENKNSYLLTLIDIYSRFTIGYIFKKSIKQKEVRGLIDKIKIILNISKLKIERIRNDNGSQFIANSVKKNLKLVNIEQEFT